MIELSKIVHDAVSKSTLNIIITARKKNKHEYQLYTTVISKMNYR